MVQHADIDHTGIPGVGGSGIAATIFDAKGDIIAASAADTAARLAVGSNGLFLIAASGETTGLKWSAVPGQLLAYTADTSGDNTTNSATLVDADATNLAVTFTAPASGNVLIRLTGSCDTSTTTNAIVQWGVRESTSIIFGPSVVLRTTAAVAVYAAPTREYIKTGLTPGNSYTYKFAIASSSGTMTLRCNTTDGPSIIAVYALP